MVESKTIIFKNTYMNLHLNILCDEDLLMLFLPGKVNDIERKCQKVHVQKGE